ncbi:MAG: hypothetical protein DSM107014_01865 [Gomphosphaeria aponina SAG 52.96 = DSM 107014]|uniref:Uncharacterized protein n=1 Tax=Gomphosphaeria aponina SAG 52.96 = DSM 107014 TaxID=1521640 RepID=A0A941JNT1_9CHRO|nr:hypothetical protein [Gomphosphaeria aponina SAG 52.96 = DSM 107014]
MNKLSLILLSSPTIFGSLLLTLLTDKPAMAGELKQTNTAPKVEKAPSANILCERQNCTGNAHLARMNTMLKEASKDEFSNLETTPEGHLILEISDEESLKAVELFGCDCVNSINVLRQMRGETVGVEGDILPKEPLKLCNQLTAEEMLNQ